MNRIPARTSLIAAASLGLASLLVAGCGAGDAPKGAKTLSFKLTDAGCDPHTASVHAGPVTFHVTNAGSTAVTELEVLDGEKILGEVENISDGLSGHFSLTLDKGTYTLKCTGGSDEEGTLTVTGENTAKTNPEADAAVSAYRRYLERNTDELVAKTAPFAAAVIAGNVAEAKALYAAARAPYERIEPVAESFGNLDPEIDARANDVPPSQFGGFHRIEKALWEDGTAAGMAPVARKLMVDVKDLQGKVKTVKLEPAQISNGANELLGEVSASKITGEEERYSHIDLVDFEANVQGSQAAFDAVEPLLKKNDPALAREINQRFAMVYTALAPYRRGSGFVSYTQLTEADTRKLAQSIDALAEPLSQVSAKIVQ
jgi:iron uptake system component EfeO